MGGKPIPPIDFRPKQWIIKCPASYHGYWKYDEQTTVGGLVGEIHGLGGRYGEPH
jgi:hypothetical protein